jgi:hypothetical protein
MRALLILQLKRHILLQRRWLTSKVKLNLRAKQAGVHVGEQAAANCHLNNSRACEYFVRLLIFQAGKESKKLAEPEGALQQVHTNNAIMCLVTSVQQDNVKRRADTPLVSFPQAHV